MLPQIKPLIVGLASPGVFWLATSVAFGQDAPAPQGPPTAAPTSPATYRALLLSSGKVVRGVIVDVPAAKAFCLKGSGGPVPYPKTNVLKVAQSVEELYEFQLVRLPAGDADERMKLARWCLTEKLIPQAEEQLKILKEMCPNDPVIRGMLYSLDASQGGRRSADPAPVDSAVRQSSADVPDPLDPSVLKSRKKYNGLPQIFDLPPAQAVKRFNEFAEHVQPVLQQNCVKCHNEKYQGNFQLVEAKTRRDRTSTDILRANLDATLNLVNPDDPSRSELLSAGLVPHGGNRNAIFKGPNDQGYMILVAWLKRVRPVEATAQKGQANPNGKSGFNSADPTTGDGFATDRSGKPNPSPGFPLAAGGGYPALPNGGSGPGGMGIPQSGATINRYEESAEFLQAPGDNPQFPPPYAVGGAPINPPTQPKPRPKTSAKGDTTPPQPPKANSSQNAKLISPNTAIVPPAETIKELPGMDNPLYPTLPPKGDDTGNIDDDAPPPPSAKKKPKKIDNALLEKMMKNRNGGGTGTGTP